MPLQSIGDCLTALHSALDIADCGEKENSKRIHILRNLQELLLECNSEASLNESFDDFMSILERFLSKSFSISTRKLLASCISLFCSKGKSARSLNTCCQNLLSIALASSSKVNPIVRVCALSVCAYVMLSHGVALTTIIPVFQQAVNKSIKSTDPLVRRIAAESLVNCIRSVPQPPGLAAETVRISLKVLNSPLAASVSFLMKKFNYFRLVLS